mgnify:CR=1 FL=1
MDFAAQQNFKIKLEAMYYIDGALNIFFLQLHCSEKDNEIGDA